MCEVPIPVAWFKAMVCGRLLAGTAGSNPGGCMHLCLSLARVVCCEVEIFATGRSLVQRSPNDCDVSLRVI
jgi:hypothetical protein